MKLFVKSKLIHLFEHVIVYKCFIDDLFIIYDNGNGVEDFSKWMNNVNEHIRYIWAYSRDQLPYLDTVVYRTNSNQLAVKPFKKTSDRPTNLHYGSFHHLYLRQNLQFLRPKRNSINNNEYLAMRWEMTEQIKRIPHGSGPSS